MKVVTKYSRAADINVIAARECPESSQQKNFRMVKFDLMIEHESREKEEENRSKDKRDQDSLKHRVHSLIKVTRVITSTRLCPSA